MCKISRVVTSGTRFKFCTYYAYLIKLMARQNWEKLTTTALSGLSDDLPTRFFGDQQLFIPVYPCPGLYPQHAESVRPKRRKMHCRPDLASPPSDSPFLDRIPARR